MKNQALFFSKDKSKKKKCCLLQFLYGACRVKTWSAVAQALLFQYIRACCSQHQLNRVISQGFS